MTAPIAEFDHHAEAITQWLLTAYLRRDDETFAAVVAQELPKLATEELSDVDRLAVHLQRRSEMPAALANALLTAVLAAAVLAE